MGSVEESYLRPFLFFLEEGAEESLFDPELDSLGREGSFLEEEAEEAALEAIPSAEEAALEAVLSVEDPFFLEEDVDGEPSIWATRLSMLRESWTCSGCTVEEALLKGTGCTAPGNRPGSPSAFQICRSC